MSEDKFKVYKISVGIRYQPNFILDDVGGSIIQSLVRETKSPFPRDYFYIVQSGIVKGEKILRRKESNTYIKFNPTDLIYENYFEENFVDKFSYMIDKEIPYLFDLILKRNKVRDYFRIGIIFGYKVDLTNTCNKVIEEFTKGKLNRYDIFQCRFSKKLPCDLSLVKKEIEDYRNLIITIRKNDNVAYHEVDFDFQHYYIPELGNIDEKGFINFFKESKEIVLKEYEPLLINKNI